MDGVSGIARIGKGSLWRVWIGTLLVIALWGGAFVLIESVLSIRTVLDLGVSLGVSVLLIAGTAVASRHVADAAV